MPLDCSFCARTQADVELRFRAERGGLPPWICSVCVMQFAEVVEAYRQSPDTAAALVRAVNAQVRAAR